MAQADSKVTPQGVTATAWGIIDSLTIGGPSGIIPFGDPNDPSVRAGYQAGTLIVTGLTLGLLGATSASAVAESSLSARGVLQDAAAEVRTAADHPLAADRRTIAVGQRANGERVVSLSNGLDAGTLRRGQALLRPGSWRAPSDPPAA